MLKGKHLFLTLGVAALAYYLFMQNKKKKAISAPSTASANFTGDLNVFDYQSADGRMTDRQIKRLANAKGERANRIYGRIASRRNLL